MSRALTALLRMHEANALSEPGDKDILVALSGIAFCIAAFVSAQVLRVSNVLLMFCLGACAACFAGHLFLTSARAI